MQNYRNFRIIYVDDASTDGTADLVAAYIEKYNLHDQIILIRSEQRMRKLYHLYKTFHSCKDHEIIVQVDADDTLADPDVLSLLNGIFTKNNVWLSYGSHRAKSGFKSGGRKLSAEEKEKALFRKPLKPLSIGHLKAFYAWLFKKIKLEDLLTKNIAGWQGKFYPVANDAATMYPMLEMAREHLWYNQKIVYNYNDRNSLCSHYVEKKLQHACAQELINLPAYPTWENNVIKRYAQAHGVVFSLNPYQLQKLLVACKELVADVQGYTIFYEPQSLADELVFKELEKKYHDFRFYKSLNQGCVIEVLRSLPCKHILCLHDDAVIAKKIPCNTWINELERTGAYGCFGMPLLDMFEKHGIAYQQIDDSLYAWQFVRDTQNLVPAHNACVSLYRKETLEAFFTCSQQNPWTKGYKVGLFFE